MARRLIATGILGWTGYERQSKEYGFFGIENKGYGNDAKSSIHTFFDAELLKSLIGKRVRLVAVVRESRESGHVGDMYLFPPDSNDYLKPTRPEVGQEIEISVGVLQMKKDSYFVNPLFGANSQGTGKFQMDPEKLYNLHDQTVDVFVEETNDPLSPLTRMVWDRDNTRGTGAGDGFFQLNTVAGEGDVVRIKPNIQSHGDGLFSISPPPMTPGSKFEVSVETSVKNWTIKLGNKYVGTVTTSLDTKSDEINIRTEGDCPFIEVHEALQRYLDGDTSVMNANGQIVVQVGDKKYRIKEGERPCNSTKKRKKSAD